MKPHFHGCSDIIRTFRPYWGIWEPMQLMAFYFCEKYYILISQHHKRVTLVFVSVYLNWNRRLGDICSQKRTPEPDRTLSSLSSKFGILLINWGPKVVNIKHIQCVLQLAAWNQSQNFKSQSFNWQHMEHFKVCRGFKETGFH